MRVLHVHSGNLFGGIETLLQTVAEHAPLWPEMKSEFALCYRGRLQDELQNIGAIVHGLNNVRVSKPSSVRRARRALSLLLQAEQFDVAIFHAPWAYAIFSGVVQAANVPLTFWMHSPARGKHWLERWTRLTTPDLVVCNSAFTASSVFTVYPDLQPLIIFPPVSMAGRTYSTTSHNASLSDARTELRRELTTHPEDTVIIQVSRMEEWKGHQLTLEALAELQETAAWTCWFVGGAQRPAESKYLDSLQRYAAKLGIAARVRFVGQRSDVGRLLQAADIFCQPNLRPEPFGIVFVEAMAMALPVVTANIGGAAEIVDGSCGFLTPTGDRSALAHALRELVGNPLLRAQLGAVGPDRARRLCDPAAQLQLLHRSLETHLRTEVAA